NRGASYDVYSAMRATPIDAFGPPSLAFMLPSNDTKMSMTADGLYVTLSSDLPSGKGLTDVWDTERATASASLPPFAETYTDDINTSGADLDGVVTEDGLTLYVAPRDGSAQHIRVSTRGSRAAMFQPPSDIPVLQSSATDADPAPASDPRLLLFSSNRV